MPGSVPVPFDPAGRTLPFIPQPGSLGAMEINGVFANITKFDPKFKGEPIDVSNFNSPVDAVNGALWREWLGGACDGEITVSAPRDSSTIGWNPLPNDTGQLVIYYSASLWIAISYLVIDMGGPQEATKAGELTVTVKANGLPQFFGRNNLGGNDVTISP